MKVNFLLVLFTISFGNCFGQDLEYTHDANGNRIIRETIVLKMAGNAAASSNTSGATAAEEEGKATDVLGTAIQVYPNPTTGMVVLECTDGDVLEGAQILVLDANGRQVIHQNVEAAQTKIDLSAYANGVYMLRLTYNGRQVVWRVVKE